MMHKGIEYSVALSAPPDVWKWQFRIGDIVKSGKTETRINLLAVRRVQVRIDRELKKTTQAPTRSFTDALEPLVGGGPVRRLSQTAAAF